MQLRLRSEWSDVDSHQKVILSDEVGMGLTTYFLSEILGLKSFYDARHYLHILNPQAFTLLKTSRRGPGKCPDFIAEDGKSNLSVIECKGGQTSQSALLKAMSGGIDQKKNVVAASSAIKHGLVAGLYIPQYRQNEASRIHLVDPEWNEVEAILDSSSVEERGMVAAQMSLAQAFYFSGLPAAASLFGRGQVAKLARLPDSVLAEFRAAIDQFEGGQKRVDIDLAPIATVSYDQPIVDTRISVEVNGRIFSTLLEIEDPEEALLSLYSSQRDRKLLSSSSEQSAWMEDPFGLRMTLSTSGQERSNSHKKMG